MANNYIHTIGDLQEYVMSCPESQFSVSSGNVLSSRVVFYKIKKSGAEIGTISYSFITEKYTVYSCVIPEARPVLQKLIDDAFNYAIDREKQEEHQKVEAARRVLGVSTA